MLTNSKLASFCSPSRCVPSISKMYGTERKLVACSGRASKAARRLLAVMGSVDG